MGRAIKTIINESNYKKANIAKRSSKVIKYKKRNGTCVQTKQRIPTSKLTTQRYRDNGAA